MTKPTQYIGCRVHFSESFVQYFVKFFFYFTKNIGCCKKNWMKSKQKMKVENQISRDKIFIEKILFLSSRNVVFNSKDHDEVVSGHENKSVRPFFDFSVCNLVQFALHWDHVDSFMMIFGSVVVNRLFWRSWGTRRTSFVYGFPTRIHGFTFFLVNKLRKTAFLFIVCMSSEYMFEKSVFCQNYARILLDKL